MNKRTAAFFLTLVVANVVAAQNYQLETVAEDLSWPWSVAFLADGELLVAELDGQLRRVSAGGATGPDIAGVPPVYFAGQGGLFDVVLHPDFATNQQIYLSYAEGTPKDNGTAVARATLRAETLSDVEVVFRVSPRKDTPVHYGGRMAFLPDGTLLVTTGDGFNFREAAQDKASHLGKTLRLNDDGSPASGNPFVEAPHVYTYGHRNPQGLLVSAQGDVYLHEHGPKGGDEINILEPGTNYGWPAITYGKDYNGAHVSPFTHWEGMAQPQHVWTPSIAPSGFAIYEAELFPEWRGSLFVGALVDREVRRLTVKNGRILAEEALFAELGARIRDVRVGPGGRLYIVTDGSLGKILRAVPMAAK